MNDTFAMKRICFGYKRVMFGKKRKLLQKSSIFAIKHKTFAIKSETFVNKALLSGINACLFKLQVYAKRSQIKAKLKYKYWYLNDIY